MTVIGNLLLIISFLIFLSLNTGALTRPAPSGDSAVGYGWSLIILNLAFLICMIFIATIIGFKGGFDWVSPKKSNRFLIVTVALLSILITVGLSSVFRHEHGPVPSLIRLYSSFVPVAVPIVLIIGGIVLLNSGLRNGVPVAAYKWPLVLVSVIGVTGVISATYGFIAESKRNRKAIVESYQQQYDDNQLRMLAEIDSNDVMKDFVFLLVFTDGNQQQQVRERAVAKMKTHPEWQQELIRLLQTDWVAEPFQFLASNDVDDPSLFPEPIRLGVLNQARLIRESIRNSSHPSHFYADRFGWDVERVIRTVNKFKGMGVDFKPAMRELRAALDEPWDGKKHKFTAMEVLDEWIKKN